MKNERSLPRAFGHALNGIIQFTRQERNGKIQLVIAACTMLAAFFFSVSSFEWIALLLCIGGVLSLEMLNSAIEKLGDFVHDTYHPGIKIIKDVAAAAVLFFSFISAIIGIIIFFPRIIQLF